MIVLCNCSASWWADRLPCRAADWRAGHSGDSRHFASPGSVIRDRGHHRGPADTWVTLSESAPHLASLFHFPTPNVLFRYFVNVLSALVYNVVLS